MSLARRTASPSSSKGMTTTTGPKISSTAARSAGSTGASTVGGNQFPGPSGHAPRTATGEPSGTKEATVSRWSAEISGPISVVSCVGSPTLTPLTAGSSRVMNRSYTARSTKMRERAQQSWPALSNTPLGARAAASSRSASANTMFALLPPSSRVTRLTCCAQPAMTERPTSVDPVKQIFRTAGWSTNRCPTTLPLPGRICNTPSGSPASSASSPIRSALSGVSSAGLSTTVLPAASAGANPQPAMVIGKFQGTMTPTTPSGS